MDTCGYIFPTSILLTEAIMAVVDLPLFLLHCTTTLSLAKRIKQATYSYIEYLLFGQ